MLVKVVAVQTTVGSRLTLEEKMYIFKQRPDFVCLPEYSLVGPDVPDFRRAALSYKDDLSYLARLSDELSTCLIGGTLIEPVRDRLYNSAPVFLKGNLLGKYRKRRPVGGETAKGISPGENHLIVEVDDIRVGLLICADVMSPELFEEMGALRADLIFAPTVSPLLPDDSLTQKQGRDRKYYQQGAALSGAVVVKTCAVGSLFGKPLQGRSLIAAPWGIVERVESMFESEKRILTTTIDLEELQDFRQKMKRVGQVNAHQH